MELSVDSYMRQNFAHKDYNPMLLASAMFAQWRLEAFFGSGGKVAELMQQFDAKLKSDEVTVLYPHDFLPENVYVNMGMDHKATGPQYECFLSCFYVHRPRQWWSQEYDPLLSIPLQQIYTREHDFVREALYFFDLPFTVRAITEEHAEIVLTA